MERPLPQGGGVDVEVAGSALPPSFDATDLERALLNPQIEVDYGIADWLEVDV